MHVCFKFNVVDPHFGIVKCFYNIYAFQINGVVKGLQNLASKHSQLLKIVSFVDRGTFRPNFNILYKAKKKLVMPHSKVFKTWLQSTASYLNYFHLWIGVLSGQTLISCTKEKW